MIGGSGCNRDIHDTRNVILVESAHKAAPICSQKTLQYVICQELRSFQWLKHNYAKYSRYTANYCNTMMRFRQLHRGNNFIIHYRTESCRLFTQYRKRHDQSGTRSNISSCESNRWIPCFYLFIVNAWNSIECKMSCHKSCHKLYRSTTVIYAFPFAFSFAIIY